MDSVARLIIPSVDEAIVQPVVNRLTRRFGGATLWPASGTYVSDRAGIIAEPVTVLEVAFTDGPDEQDFLTVLAEELRVKLDQESVYLSVRRETVQLIGPDGEN